MPKKLTATAILARADEILAQQFDAELERIARAVAGVPTLAGIESHALFAWQIKALLTAAYIAGRNSK